jgi:hypothetical protein
VKKSSFAKKKSDPEILPKKRARKKTSFAVEDSSFDDHIFSDVEGIESCSV